MLEIRIEPVRGHYEVYRGEKFLFSADTLPEALRELRQEKEAERDG